MAVLIEALNIVLRDEIFNIDPSKREVFLQNIPTKAFCSDGILYRVGFMDPKYAEQYIHYLENELHLKYLDDENSAQDFVVVDMLKGPTTKCNWIDFKRESLFAHRKEFQKCDEEFSIAWSVDNYVGKVDEYYVVNVDEQEISEQFLEDGISFPKDWNPDKAIYSSDLLANPEMDLEEINRDNTTITYKKKSTGELVYVGIPDIDEDNSKLKNKENISAKNGTKDNTTDKGLLSKLKRFLK